MQKSAIILLSGGLDSTAALSFYKEMGYETKPIYVNYGQAAHKVEEDHAFAVSEYFELKLETLTFHSGINFSQGLIKGRNAFLIFAALISHQEHSGLISMGIHSGTNYYDCSSDFANSVNRILANYTMGEMIFDAPFINWSKRMIYDYCIKRDVPIHLTYSCENGIVPPCGHCDSCLDREALNAPKTT